MCAKRTYTEEGVSFLKPPDQTIGNITLQMSGRVTTLSHCILFRQVSLLVSIMRVTDRCVLPWFLGYRFVGGFRLWSSKHRKNRALYPADVKDWLICGAVGQGVVSYSPHCHSSAMQIKDFFQCADPLFSPLTLCLRL